MQNEFARHYPSLDIKILGINEFGQESANASITNGRDIPWLQDVDVLPAPNGNGVSDVWYDSWQIEYRDVVVVDAGGNEVGRYNVTPNSLALAPNYAALKQMFIDSAKKPPATPWQSPIERLDVTNDGRVELNDALQVINVVQLRTYPGGTLPTLNDGAVPPAYYDVTGSGSVAAQDAIVIINHLAISVTPQAALSAQVVAEESTMDGESGMTGMTQDLATGESSRQLSVAPSESTRTVQVDLASGGLGSASVASLNPESVLRRSTDVRLSSAHQRPTMSSGRADDTSYEKAIDELFAMGW